MVYLCLERPYEVGLVRLRSSPFHLDTDYSPTVKCFGRSHHMVCLSHMESHEDYSRLESLQPYSRFSFLIFSSHFNHSSLLMPFRSTSPIRHDLLLSQLFKGHVMASPPATQCQLLPSASLRRSVTGVSNLIPSQICE